MSASDDQAIKAVSKLIQKAFYDRASDIHFEPFEEEFAIRIRVDGVLQRAPDVSLDEGRAMVKRVKIMSAMDTEINDVPQDGRIFVEIKDRKLDLRVSVVPTTFGERVTMRILDRQSVLLSLGDLGLLDDSLAKLKSFCGLPNGIVLSTGPTGSGKTTTMYSMMMELDREHCAVFSIEDPVEYVLPGVSQIPIRPAKGVTFARAARSIMRQDPDVVMIGELRDFETAQMAVQVSLTGHLVFTQLHASTAPGALKRLLDMGVEPFLLNQSVAGVISQRLARKLCKKCKREASPNPDMLPPEARAFLEQNEGTFFGSAGCDDCRGTGYRGRIGIQEILIPDDAVKRAVTMGEIADIRTAAKASGMRTLLDDGLLYAARGITSVKEVMRVSLVGPNE